MSHLTAEQLDHYRDLLLAAKETALLVLDQSASGRKPVEASGQTIGRLTRMDAIQVQAMEQMNQFQLEIRLKQIEASLTELETGRYGLCRNCRGPIDSERLEVLPEAPFCMPCQEGFET